MVSDEYSDIWDCCCDHGFLGIELLAQKAANVHFVDCEKHLIRSLEKALRDQYQHKERWQLHHSRVEDLRLAHAEGQLLIIAGVGGDTCAAMVKALLTRHPGIHLDFILCPVRQVEQLRKTLSSLELGLLHDCLVEERGRYYEVLFLRRFGQQDVHTIMQKLSPSDNAAHKNYLENRIEYLSKVSDPGCINALSAYKTLLESC